MLSFFVPLIPLTPSLGEFTFLFGLMTIDQTEARAYLSAILSRLFFH
jgi:hypothetical protein